MTFGKGDKVWYLGYSKWFRAYVKAEPKNDRYWISILTEDGRVVEAVGVDPKLLRPLKCVLYSKVLYHESVENLWPYSDSGDNSDYPSVH